MCQLHCMCTRVRESLFMQGGDITVILLYGLMILISFLLAFFVVVDKVGNPHFFQLSDLFLSSLKLPVPSRVTVCSNSQTDIKPKRDGHKAMGKIGSCKGF